MIQGHAQRAARAREIRQARRDGAMLQDIAARFGVSKARASQICKGIQRGETK